MKAFQTVETMVVLMAAMMADYLVAMMAGRMVAMMAVTKACK